MRLTIARKIALAVISIVILCIATMALVTNANLQRGFVAYLNEVQTEDLDQLRVLIEDRYRQEGNFDWLRRKPRALRELLDQMHPQIQVEGGRVRRPDPPDGRQQPPPDDADQGPPVRADGDQTADARPPPRGFDGRPPPPGGIGRPPPRDGPPPRGPLRAGGYGVPERAAGAAGAAAAAIGTDSAAPVRDGSAPPREDQPSPRDGSPPRADQPSPRDDPPPRAGQSSQRDDPPPPRADQPPPRADQPPPRAENPPPQDGRGPNDPVGFAARISIVDADNHVLMGPPDFPPGIERDIKVDGKVVGRMRLMPLRQAAGVSASAGGFLREQLKLMLWLSLAIILISTLASLWLARHLLRPVVALRAVTARLARGQFDARAPVLSRDELAELALHVNKMAQALEESEQKRRKMLADVAHELRTPLTVIRGEIEALLDGIRKADPRALESLHAEVLRLNQLVDDLHQLTLADAGDLHFDWQKLDLGALLLPVLERYRTRMAAAGLALSWTLPEQPLWVRGDGGRLTQVLINLLENSVRYTDAPGRVVVTLTLRAVLAELLIEDSAPGVPAEACARLFDRMYRVDQARSRASGGSGLGLAICKAMVEAHQGSIAATQAPLGGVRVQVLLPALP